MCESNRVFQTDQASNHRQPSPPMTAIGSVRKPEAPPPPFTSAGIAKYRSILSPGESVNVLVTGNLPKGETTCNVTYSVVDKYNKAILSQIFLPDVSNRYDSVSMLLKVQQASGAYDIGTFDANGEFNPASFLSVSSELGG